MKAKDVPPTDRTRWTAYEDIERYGWTMKEVSVDDEEKRATQSVLKALAIKQLSTSSKNAAPIKTTQWTLIHWEHAKSTKHTVNGAEVEYPATKAFYRNFHNCDRGIIVASNLKSPQHTNIGKASDPANLAPLQHWSDITFQTWKHLCEAKQKPIGGLKHILHLHVITEDIDEVVKHITGIEAQRFSEPYPGHAVEQVPDSEDARGMIGSMALSGDAYLLIQHKDVFGSTRSFKAVQMWDANDGQRSGVAGDVNIPNILVTLS